MVVLISLTAIILQLQWIGICAGGVYKDPQGRFRCPLSPITARYADPGDKYCNYWFLCHRGHAFPRKCPIRHAFHPSTLQCMNREQVPEDICPFEIECDQNGYVADKNDCTKYYLCFYRMPTHFSCTEGKIFDPETSTCKDNSAKAKECKRPTPPPHYVKTTTKAAPVKKTPSLTTAATTQANKTSPKPAVENNGKIPSNPSKAPESVAFTQGNETLTKPE